MYLVILCLFHNSWGWEGKWRDKKIVIKNGHVWAAIYGFIWSYASSWYSELFSSGTLVSLHIKQNFQWYTKAESGGGKKKRQVFSKPISKVKFTLEWVIVELVLAHLGHTGWCCWSHCSPCCRNSGQTEHCGLGNSVEGSEAWHSNKGLSEHPVAMLEQKAWHNLTPEKIRIWKGRNNLKKICGNCFKSHLQLTGM